MSLKFLIQTVLQGVDQGAVSGATRAAGAYKGVNSQANAANAAVGTLGATTRGATYASEEYGRTGSSAMQSQIAGAGQLISRLAALAAAYVGVHTVVSKLKSAIGDQVDLQSVEIGMGSLMNQNFDFTLGGETLTGAEKFGASMEAAKNYTSDLAQSAASMPGSFKDFGGMSNAGAGQLFAAGESSDDLLQRVKSMAYFAPIVGGNRQDFANQVGRMISGQAGMDNQAALMMKNMGALGDLSFEEFNKLSMEKRIEITYSGMDQFTGSDYYREFVEGSADVQFSTLQDNLFGITGLFGQISKNLMPVIVGQALRLNWWFKENYLKVQQIADVAADKLAWGIELAGDMAIFLGDNIDRIIPAAMTLAGIFATYKTASMFGGFGNIGSMVMGGGGGGIISSIGGALSGALKSGVMAGGLTTGVSGLLPGLMSGGGAFFTSIGASLAPILAALPPIAIGLAVLVGIVAAVVGAMMVVRSNLWGLGEMFDGASSEFMDVLGDLGANLWGLFKVVAVPLGVVLVGVLIPALQVMSFVINGVIWYMNMMGGAFYGLFVLVKQLIENPFDVKGASNAAVQASTNFKFSEVLSDVTTEKDSGQDKGGAKADGMANSKGGGGLETAAPAQVHIGELVVNNQYEDDVSPDRIAFDMIDAIDMLQANRGTTMRPNMAT